MHAIADKPTRLAAGVEHRSNELYQESLVRMRARTDRLMANLMIGQWLAGIACALWISPKTWIGDTSHIHVHVWAALFLGAAISVFPVMLARFQPGQPLTRYTIAVGQMLTSALLIHLSGGRLETHFHVFGSLAILAFYRDWRVLLAATVVVATDHMVRGLFWPQSVFGVLTASSWRWLEHAGWVLFEDAFLLISIRQSLNEMSEAAARSARLEGLNAEIEAQVAERTAELRTANQRLMETSQRLADTSRQAGMAEVATNVLHNVGNVLNSVNVSAEAVAGKVRQFRITNLKSVADLLREHSHDLPEFLSRDPRGMKLPDYLTKLADHLAEPQKAILEEVNSLRDNIEHIKGIVAMQQTHARRSGVRENLSAVDLMEDAIRINSAAFMRHAVQLEREFEEVPILLTDRHLVLQILVNLLSNAKYALDEVACERRMVVRISPHGNEGVKFTVSDNGVGIEQENLTRIFQHGFTTKKDGHGFGLHSGALAARALGGKLTAHSDGLRKGSTFTLELPLHPPLTALS